jgi:aspartyl-tRNA(Asn)/glutamyl-tRNA(Gln) amidotransferase subunit A
VTAPRTASARELAHGVRTGRWTARDLIEGSLGSLAADEAARLPLHATLAIDADGARRAADHLPPHLRERPLAGVPVAVKDNLVTLGLPTTCGSRVLEGFVSPYEATAVRRLRDAGALLVAKTNLDEFGMGSSTEHSAFGPTRNPHDRTRVPGGSSGGSAALVASGAVRIALGSDTGGSVRQPAAFCGVVGIKPTYGRVSRFGLVAFASSLDCVGVLGATVDDAALGLEAIAGPDPRDATCSSVPAPDLRPTRSDDLSRLVIGRPREYLPSSLDPRIADAVERAAAALRRRGADVRDVSLPHTELAIPAYYVLAPAEASANLARYDGVRFGPRVTRGDLISTYAATRSRGFGPEVIRRILLGTYALSAGYYDAYYRRATQARAQVAEDFRRAFASGVHALLTPTTPTPAFALGAVTDPYEMYLSDVFTVPANLAGIPAISVPWGAVDGLPLGVQVMANHFAEPTMLRIAAALESERDVA